MKFKIKLSNTRFDNDMEMVITKRSEYVVV